MISASSTRLAFKTTRHINRSIKSNLYTINLLVIMRDFQLSPSNWVVQFQSKEHKLMFNKDHTK